ncbi:MAG: hypothetical protein E7161_01475 [Firmicutes bacterium]|nr:hypothetical protein [Bacillota bacterium]
MASIGTKIKKTPKKKKTCLFGIISFFAVTLIFGIQAVYAYYNDTKPLNLLAGLIGDFDTGDGDVNMMIYKETGQNTNVYTRSYVVPSVGYVFNDTLTTCTKPCDDDETENCKATCGKDGSSSCYYDYDDVTKSFELTSAHKVTCKFYFNAPYDSDIKVYIMKEDLDGEKNYNNKKYTLIENIPAYGYTYAGYECDNDGVVNYISATKEFNVSTQTKDTCYAYFNDTKTADIMANIYVQVKVSGTTYQKVDSIPTNRIYELSEHKNSYCYDSTGNDMGATINYTDGSVSITASGKQTCDVYLDLVANE